MQVNTLGQQIGAGLQDKEDKLAADMTVVSHALHADIEQQIQTSAAALIGAFEANMGVLRTQLEAELLALKAEFEQKAKRGNASVAASNNADASRAWAADVDALAQNVSIHTSDQNMKLYIHLADLTRTATLMVSLHYLLRESWRRLSVVYYA